MLMTKEVDYAIRILRALSTGEKMTTGEICEREYLPKQFAYKIIKKLEKADIIEILRGVEGGCHLKADLSKVTLYDITGDLESVKKISECMDPNSNCPRMEAKGFHCSVHKHLMEIQSTIEDELRSYTIKSLLE